MKKTENILGFMLILLVLILGKTLLKTDALFFKILVGVGFGYALMRAYTGFAGSVNRAYNTGSAKLMRTMMFMFFITCVLSTAVLFNGDPASYGLWINPINFGLILGGLLFGFGMAFSSCCATGVLTDLVTGLPRAFITLIFFGLGIFIGFPVQNTAGWVKNSWFTTAIGKKLAGGVYLPDFFKWDGLKGYLGSLILVGLLCILVTSLTYRYERRRKEKNTYIGHTMEKIQDQNETFDSKDYKFFSTTTYNRFFVKPWTLKQGAIVISILFTLLMGVTKSGWGASTPYGIWFGKLLMVFGVSVNSIASFTHMNAKTFTQPFFENAASVQNFGIIVGTAIYLLTAGKFKETFLSEMHITPKEVLQFALGGFAMGFGTRLSNGCNVGALYTPIANFSLSGWIFFAFLVSGGIIGNVVVKMWFKAERKKDEMVTLQQETT